MDFMAIVFVTLFFSFVVVNIWDHWQERHKLFTEDGRFLRHQFLRGLIRPATESISVSPDAKFAIQSSGTAHRCEVCHQPDKFDFATGFCQRCNHRTV